MVTVGDAATAKEKEVKTRYPVTTGLVAGTTKQEGRTINLVPQSSNVARRLKEGIG